MEGDGGGLVELVAANKVAELEQILEDFMELIVEGRNFKMNKPKGRDGQKWILPCDGLSVLHVAAFYDNLEMLLFLERLGIPLNALSGASYYPLHYACAGGAIECASYLLSMVPEQAVLASDCQWHPIFLATFSNSPEILQMLLDYGANLRSKPNVDNRPFEQALRSRHIECLFILLTHKCKTDVSRWDTSPLMVAVNQGMGHALEPLLDLGLDPYFVSSRGESALSFACLKSDLPAVRVLCNRMETVEIPACDELRFSSIARYAVASKNLEILRLVLEKGCDLNRYDACDDLPADAIRGAINDDDLGVRIVEMLVKYGFDINCRCERTGKSFLDRIVEWTLRPYPKIVEFLLSHGADVDTKLPGGESLLEKVNKFADKGLRYNSRVAKLYRDIFKRFFPDEIE